MGGEGGVHEGAVQVAGVVSHHHAGAGGKVVEPFHFYAHTGAREKDPREETGTVATPVQAGQYDHAG
jgi:hypothetical protein